jgi:dinuclear metal center YbgI/SA1388 family protein
MKLKRLIELIEEKFPPETAMQGDPIGLQIQSGRTDIKRALACLEVNKNVIEEAVSKKCDCIITFHPLIYFPMEKILDDDRQGSLSQELIRNSIALVSIHTNFDVYPNGTSAILANKLGFSVSGFLVPDKVKKGFGMGVVAEIPEGLHYSQLLEKIFEVCGSPPRWNTPKNDVLRKVAIVGGSGTSFIDEALAVEADVFITADVSYHRFHQVTGKMMLVDAGHYEMEKYVPEAIAKEINILIKEYNENLEIVLSEVYTNPVNYFYPFMS